MNTPFLFLALVLLKLNASLKKDFRSLMICIANDSTYYDVKLINFLISAEDHRFRYHTGVDPIAVEDIQFIIAKLKYKNIGVIITDHNVGETLAITDRAYLLYEGTILQKGTPQALASDEDVRTKYLGSGFVLKRSVSVEKAQKEHAEFLERQAQKVAPESD